MGCDIHLFVEVRQEDGSWKAVLSPRLCEGEDGEEVECYHWHFGRSYSAFAVLADVRNGSHHAEFNPISEPRGLPDDRDPVLNGKEEDLGDHSFSWLLLSEILGYDWSQKVTFRARIPRRRLKELTATGQLISYEECPDAPESLKAEWMETCREACTNIWKFMGDVHYALPGVDPERIRIVFGFDS